jgi:predicted nucleotidyltransferase
MVDSSILDIIYSYLKAVNQAGIKTRKAVLFGSWAKGEQTEDSDIDLVVIAPELDNLKDRKLIDRLWELTALVPKAWRIEPIACGERQWLEDDERIILEIARQEGQMIPFNPQAV